MEFNTKQEKKKLIDRFTPPTRKLRNLPLAFIFGGSICLGAELLRRVFINLGASDKTALSLVSLSLILLASLFTALGFFDKIAKFAGAGTLVPITGFANSITSEALDSKAEGFVLGVGAKIFTVAGPVILYGLSSGVLYGVFLFIKDIFSRFL